MGIPRGMAVSQEHLDARSPGKMGKVVSVSLDKKLIFVRHGQPGKGSVGAYWYYELDLIGIPVGGPRALWK